MATKIGTHTHLSYFVLALASFCLLPTLGLSPPPSDLSPSDLSPSDLSPSDLSVQDCLEQLHPHLGHVTLPQSQDARSVICEDILRGYRLSFPSTGGQNSGQLPVFHRPMTDADRIRELKDKIFNYLHKGKGWNDNLWSPKSLHKQSIPPLGPFNAITGRFFTPFSNNARDFRENLRGNDVTGPRLDLPDTPSEEFALSPEGPTPSDDGSVGGVMSSSQGRTHASKLSSPTKRGWMSKRRRTMSINNALVSLSDMLVQRGIDRLNRNRQSLRRQMMLEG